MQVGLTELAARSACALASLLSFSALRAAAKALSSSTACPDPSPYTIKHLDQNVTRALLVAKWGVPGSLLATGLVKAKYQQLLQSSNTCGKQSQPQAEAGPHRGEMVHMMKVVQTL